VCTFSARGCVANATWQINTGWSVTASGGARAGRCGIGKCDVTIAKSALPRPSAASGLRTGPSPVGANTGTEPKIKVG
jgi:hypothetical protein